MQIYVENVEMDKTTLRKCSSRLNLCNPCLQWNRVQYIETRDVIKCKYVLKCLNLVFVFLYCKQLAGKVDTHNNCQCFSSRGFFFSFCCKNRASVERNLTKIVIGKIENWPTVQIHDSRVVDSNSQGSRTFRKIRNYVLFVFGSSLETLQCQKLSQV